jgi:phosphate:Na+ symporter
MTIFTLINSLGGLALFLLAMAMMTDGLKAFAGHHLRVMLERFTLTPLRGVAAGVVVTGLVQHSGAVTVAVIGFVNAGLMNLRQALGVVFGTNIGTTMTAWLVSLVGVGLNIQLLAMPLLALGVVLRFGAFGSRWHGLGQALAGFGLFFMGLGILQEAFGTAAEQMSSVLRDQTSWLLFLSVGFLATVFTQSSSAALALVITAATGGLLTFEAGAAAVIGANLGSTSTAVFAALKATANAKRLVMGHVLFNVLTGLVALSLLPMMLIIFQRLAGQFGMGTMLAMFHTLFNILGVALILPFSGLLAAWLEKRFGSLEEDLGRPQFLDKTLVALPSMAVPALRQELSRQRHLVGETLVLSLKGLVQTERLEALKILHKAIESFIEHVSTSPMDEREAQDLAVALRIARYLDEAARLSGAVLLIRAEAVSHPSVEKLVAVAFDCAALLKDAEQGPMRAPTLAEKHREFENCYQHAKQALLYQAANGSRTVAATDGLLNGFSALRRAINQMVKADIALGNVTNQMETEISV